MMRAWLQGDVGGPASGRVPGGRQGFGLRVGLTGSSVEPLADDVSVAHDDAPDPRVRCSGAPAAFPDGDRAGHELPVALGVAHAPSSVVRPREMRARHVTPAPTPSPIRTLTVGSGFTPDQRHGRLPWARGLRPHLGVDTAGRDLHPTPRAHSVFAVDHDTAFATKMEPVLVIAGGSRDRG